MQVHARSVVGIAGGTGSGKTRLAGELLAALDSGAALLLEHDRYYRDLAHLPPAERAAVNFDDPASLETELLIEHLDTLRRGAAVDVPRYDFATHTRIAGGAVRQEPAPLVIVEGILVLALEELRSRFDLRLFVDTPADLRLARRIRRDVKERGRELDSVLNQYERTARPMHDLHVAPSASQADLIVPGSGPTDRARQVILAWLNSAGSEEPRRSPD